MLKKTKFHDVISIKTLNDSTYLLRFSREGFKFLAGQYLSLGIKNDFNMREYSIHSSINDDFLEVLVKQIDEGYLSPRLRKLKEGDKLHVEGPFGFFTIPKNLENKKFYFIASGTGISPFHSITASIPNLNYTLIHGIKNKEDEYEKEHYKNYFSCTSQSSEGNFTGRVTKYLKSIKLEQDAYFYLCGNCDMIYSVFDILEDNNIDNERIFTEVYF